MQENTLEEDRRPSGQFGNRRSRNPEISGLNVSRSALTARRVDDEIRAAGLTDADVARELAAVQATIDSAQVAVRVGPEALTRILAQGRFRTLHETGVSGGSTGADERATLETELFGAADTPPVYGYLTTDTDHGGVGSPRMYGELKVVLREAVRDRVTVTSEDSLNVGVLPSPIADVDRYAFRWRWPGTAESACALIADVASGNDYAYVEAQVHGGVTVDDIEAVWVPDGFDPEVIAGWATDAPAIRFLVGGRPHT